MDYEEATQCTQNTQGVVDPRRMGRNNSGLSAADISDVMCILHPCSPAAFKIVADTANRTPYNVLQNHDTVNEDEKLTQSVLEEQETFIITKDGPNQAMDLALRFSARTRSPRLGFVFGRNEHQCDIVLDADLFKRVSNVHFSIFVNASGVLMLQDMSTNGTVVDDIVLKGKPARMPQTRMLNPGSMIQILSPKPEEIVKFIVRFPSREGHIEEYELKFQAYLERMASVEARAREDNLVNQQLAPAHLKQHHVNSVKAPFIQNQHGMHWSGGDRYNVVGLIGKGAFATVYQLATKSEGQLFAAKELEKRRFMKNGILDRKLDNEMRIMKAVSHPNIVQYVDYHDHANYMYIIMEFVPCGDLQEYMSLHGRLAEVLAKKMAAQVLDALAYLHKNQITHRDLKPDNILIANMDADEFTVKLSDFGLSKVVKVDDDTFLKTFCGTLLYCAPEVFPDYDSGKGKKRPRAGGGRQAPKYHGYSQSVDIWSFGAVLWYSLCHRPPFEGVADNTGKGMFDKIMMTPLDATDLVKQNVSDAAIALLVEMLNTDPAGRPSAAQCLDHRWFGDLQLSRDHSGLPAPDHDLVPIVEEEEVEPAEEPDVSGLSLDEQESNPASQNSEVSIHSGSLEFLDPRKSKRFKSDVYAYREEGELLASSPDISYQSIPIMLQPSSEPSAAATNPPVQRKLFGEISQSALQSSHILGQRAFDAVEMPQTSTGDVQGSGSVADDESSQRAVPGGALASPSLLGAESMVRELNMDSPHSSNSQDSDPVEPITPKTTGANGQVSKSQGNGTTSVRSENDITPKQQQRPVFNRQINIPIPASFYYDPLDPTTHNLEYASKVSGTDYMRHTTNVEMAEETSLPATASGSATENEDETNPDQTIGEDPTTVDEPQPTSPQPTSQFLRPPPRLGKLIPTDDSFSTTTLNLSTRISSWGRAPDNTHTYPDKYDTRIPKRGIVIWHFAEHIDQIPEDDPAWMKLPDLHCLISTASSAGIYVNGVLLKKGEPERPSRGRVYSGDEIVVAKGGQDGKGWLKFVCEFYHGEAKNVRPEGVARFQLESVAASQPARSKGKERERENVVSPASVAVV